MQPIQVIYIALLTLNSDMEPSIYAHTSEDGMLRALASDLPTMIFGEATSYTIEPTEAAIRHALNRYSDGWNGWTLELTTTALFP